MSRYYKLISSMPPAYITAVDRKALRAMLATNAVEAHSARKRYTIRISCDLPAIEENLTKSLEDCPKWMSEYRRGLEAMKQTIKKEQEAGRLFYEIHVSGAPGVMNYYKIHFFA